MNILKSITEKFVKQSQEILGDNLVGIYLHGSAAMGCFNEKKSDIDLLIVINNDLSEDDKLKYMNMIVELNALAPRKGLELSVIKKSVCKPFVYPTPYELHFSGAYLEWYKTNPQDYIVKMNGTDKDLAAHITIVYHRGICLCGEDIKTVFENVGHEAYFDSLWYDIEHAEADILKNPVYITLNLCRVLAYKRENLTLSKKEGGKWGLENISPRYCELIRQALDEYISDRIMDLNETEALEYAKYMIENILA